MSHSPQTTAVPHHPYAQALRAWEAWGRGWHVADHPVKLEPAFTPFRLPAPTGKLAVDDGRVKSRFANWLTGRNQTAQEQIEHATSKVPAINPVSEEAAPLMELQLYAPLHCKITPDITRHFLLSLATCNAPLTFEIIGVPQALTMQFTCRARDVAPVTAQLKAHFHEIALGQETDFLVRRRAPSATTKSVIVEFGLGREFFRPLQTPSSFEPDLLTALLGALSSLQTGEFGVVQILFQALRLPWADALLQLSHLRVGKTPLLGAELVGILRQKIATPLFAVVLRVEARSPSPERAWQIVRAVGAALTQLSSPMSNTLIPLTNENYPQAAHEQDLLMRQSRRLGMIWNCTELLALAHPPSASIRSPWLQRWRQKTKAFTPSVGMPDITLGVNTHAGQSVPVTLNQAQRMRHMHVIGATGTGKSTLLLRCILQDIERGAGVAVVDPHGELIHTLLPHLPPARWEDVILFDPADQEHPIGFNLLHAHTDLEKTLLISDFVTIFRRYATTFGDQMEAVLGQAISAVLESKVGGSLLDLRRFLLDTGFRRQFLTTVDDPDTRHYWEQEFPRLKSAPIGSLLTRLETFLRPKLIRQIVGQRQNRLDLRAIMDQQKILLVSLGQGLIGHDNAALLGTLLVAKLYQMALSRQELAATARTPFHVYLDEFQELLTPSIAAILAGARKYQLSLCLAHQELQQLRERDTAVYSAVLANPATRICFRVSEADASKLAEGFASFEATDLLRLGVGDALGRIERADHDFNLSTAPLPEIEANLAAMRRAEIRQLSRGKYASSRAEVDAELARGRSASAPLPREESPETETSRVWSTTTATPDPNIDRLETPHLPQNEIPSSHATETISAPPPMTSKTQKASTMAKLPKEEGKGGPQHRYLQSLIKQWGEEKGFRATIEKALPQGASIDVALERTGKEMAVEISVTNTAEYEAGNIQKCLAHGFAQVIFITVNQRHLNKVKAAAQEALAPAEYAKTQFLLPEEFYEFLEQFTLPTEEGTERVKGYKVKVNYKPLSAEEQEARKEAIAKTILNGLKRLKEKN